MDNNITNSFNIYIYILTRLKKIQDAHKIYVHSISTLTKLLFKF